MIENLKRALGKQLPSDHFQHGVEYGGLLHNLRYLFPFIKGKWKTGIVAVSMLTISSVLSWPLPMIMRYLIDDVITKKQMFLILPVGGVIAVFSIIIYASDLLNSYFSSRFAEEIILNLREKLLLKVFTLPKSFFDKSHSGYIISRISNDVQGIKYFITGTATRLFIEAARLIGGIIFIFYLEWRIALGVVVTLPLSFISTRFFARKNYAISHASSEIGAELSATYVETINNSQLIKSFSSDENAAKNIINKAKKSIQLVYESAILNALSTAFNKLMPSVAKLVVITLGSFWVITGHWEIGTLIAYLVYISYVYNPVTNLSSNITQLQNARATLDRIATIIKMDSEQNSDIGEEINKLKGEIEFRNVSFYYEKLNPILSDLSFKIHAGEHWAIVGKSGIGKTTLISLIMRFYEPMSGNIYYDGNEASRYNVKSLRKRIGYVSQNLQLISGTILDNLKYGNPDADTETVISYSKKAEIHDFIESLPQKYNTHLEEGGANLSIGQKQRVALARALIRDADIIILDEPTSNLDSNTENSICHMLREYFNDKTVLIIAHRPDTIKVANKVILLRKNTPPLIGELDILSREFELKEIMKYD